jgi:hypothetical protein
MQEARSTVTEDKVTLAQKRAELIESLGCTRPMLTPEERARVQGELSVVNAKIKAINTTQAAQLKADADRRRASGIAEAQANARRAVARVQAPRDAPSTRAEPVGPGFLHGGHGGGHAFMSRGDDENDDPGQTATIDGWIDAVLLRHDVTFSRTRAGKLAIHESATQAPVIKMLVDGIYAAARGQELPDLPPRAPKVTTPPKIKSKTSKKS